MQGVSVDSFFTQNQTTTTISKPRVVDGPPESSSFFMHALFQDDNLRDLILRHLQSPDLLAIAHTCKAYRKLILETRFNINARLRRFNLDSVVGFRTALGLAGALITGGFAVQFLLGGTSTVWEESDLDIVVERSSKLGILDNFLVKEEKFSTSLTPDERRSRRYGTDCFTYSKTSEVYGTTYIHLITCTSPPIQAIILKSYSSCLVNFITWNKAYSLFPRTTFIKRQAVPLTPQDSHAMRHFQKYQRRGFPFAGAASSVPEAGTSRLRSVGDKHTWKLPLDTTGITPPPPPNPFGGGGGGGDFPPDFVLESCPFDMKYEACEPDPAIQMVNSIACWPPNDDDLDSRGRFRYVRLSTFTYTHPSLKYAYTDTDRMLFDIYFVEALNKQAVHELLMKLDLQQLDEQLNAMSRCEYIDLMCRVAMLPYNPIDTKLLHSTPLDHMVEKRQRYLARHGYNKPISKYELLGHEVRREFGQGTL